MSDQGPRKNDRGATRQGIYCLTAGGTLLSYKNAGQNAQATLDALEQAIRKWNQLAKTETEPGAVVVPPRGKVDRNYAPNLPAGGQALLVYTRLLEKNGAECKPLVCEKGKGDEPGRDSLWILPAELKELAADAESMPIPKNLADRLLRFHFLDNTRGEPPFWAPGDVKSQDLKLSRVGSEGDVVRWKASGSFHLETARHDRGCKGRVMGELHLDRKTNRLVGCTLAALGDHWGEGAYTRGAPVGEIPLGVIFAIPAASDRTAEAVPPQGIRAWGGYFPGR